MRKLLLLLLLALLAAPLPAMASERARGNVICFDNQMFQPMRIKLYQTSLGYYEIENDWRRIPARSRFCQDYPVLRYLRLRVFVWFGTWHEVGPCNLHFVDPRGGIFITSGLFFGRESQTCKVE